MNGFGSSALSTSGNGLSLLFCRPVSVPNPRSQSDDLRKYRVARKQSHIALPSWTIRVRGGRAQFADLPF
jgi:hypothetical protein